MCYIVHGNYEIMMSKLIVRTLETEKQISLLTKQTREKADSS